MFLFNIDTIELQGSYSIELDIVFLCYERLY